MTSKVTMTKVLGSIPILLRFCESTNLPTIIDKICPPRQQSNFSCSIGEIISFLTINRLTHPTPLYKIDEWVERNGIEHYINESADKFNDDRLGRVLDHIYPYWNRIKNEFILSCIEKFKIDPSIIHYDITSLYFEGIYEDIDFITYGYSRDQKPDKKQVNIGLNMSDTDPFPIRWTSLPGNENDTSTVIENMNELRKMFRSENFVFIGDRAMISKAILIHSRNLGIRMVVPLKDSVATKELLSHVEIDNLGISIYNDKETEVLYKLGEYTINYSNDLSLEPLRAIIVWSKSKSDAAKRNRDKKRNTRIEKLTKLKEKLNKPYYRKKKSIEKKITKIMSKDPVNDAFSVILQGEDGVLSLDWQVDETTYQEMAVKDGFYILGTSLKEEEKGTIDVFNLYKRQYIVERSFKNLKNEIKIRPIFVTRFERFIGLIKITMLALCLYSLLEILLKRGNKKITAKRLFEILVGFVLVQFLSDDNQLSLELGPLSSTEQELIDVLKLGNLEKWLLNRIKKKFDLRNNFEKTNK